MIDLGQRTTDILDVLASKAAALGVFDKVSGHEPKNPPGSGLTIALWMQDISPYPAGSGLNLTTVTVIYNARLYTSMLTEPQDLIDPNLTRAAGLLFQAYSSDLTLGGLVREVDLLGETGKSLCSEAGYLQQGGSTYRVYTVPVPVIIDDVFDQAK